MKNNKKTIIGVVCLVALLAVFSVCWFAFGPKATKGAKHITVEVLNSAGEATEYQLDTDAEFLRQAMDELNAQGFSYDGTDSEYGIMVSTINGEVADYNTDGAYWSLFVNDEYGQYGADSQPVTDGDKYTWAYEYAK
ncbi:DUF4430 domain-containing protein [Butyrivibrio sp. VCB2006]|uniref:DUF4430 domain-containing protein n=1 Tax=Butyrivibrio sp. VCB2006 TaxID=1280679 RepID=UPI0004237B14|nr:DUF4430 domain-containing protein [Butyrivibrio sp. VCB2006]